MHAATRPAKAVAAPATGRIRFHILASLMDGHFHSGEALASACTVSRAAIWKHIQTLRSYGLDIFSVTGRGYRLAEPFEPLDETLLRAGLADPAGAAIQGLDFYPVTDSTNQRLLDHLATGSLHARVCLAEYQQAGRGRRGRDWLCPYGAGLCLSLGWHFRQAPDSMTALGLVVGLVVMQSLEQLGLREGGLKWPNDVLWQGRKLGGILLELHGQTDGPVDVVIGLGLNIRLPESVADSIDQPCSDLHQALGHVPSRNQLALDLVQRLSLALEQFGQQGFTAFRSLWPRYDLLREQPVRLTSPAGNFAGMARGVDDTGALIIAMDGRQRRFLSGDVSVRIRA